MNLMEVLTATKGKIVDGSKFYWECYGLNSWNLEFKKTQDCEISVTYDTETFVVNEIQLSDLKREVEYRWINPDFIQKVKDEYLKREYDFSESIFENKIYDLEYEEDILEKISCIFNDQPYNPKILIKLDLTEEEVNTLTKAAELQNITVDQFVENILSNIKQENQ
jgi:hypothetical protein